MTGNVFGKMKFGTPMPLCDTFSMDKTTLAHLYVPFVTDGNEEFLRAVPDDSLDNVSGQRGPEMWRQVRPHLATTSFTHPGSIGGRISDA